MIWIWVVVLVVIIGAIAVVASGRFEAMADVYDDRPDVTLPTGRPLTAQDLDGVRFSTAVRGYRMDEVDALLARIQADLERRQQHDDAIRVEPSTGPRPLASEAGSGSSAGASEAGSGSSAGASEAGSGSSAGASEAGSGSSAGASETASESNSVASETASESNSVASETASRPTAPPA